MKYTPEQVDNAISAILFPKGAENSSEGARVVNDVIDQTISGIVTENVNIASDVVQPLSKTSLTKKEVVVLLTSEAAQVLEWMVLRYTQPEQNDYVAFIEESNAKMALSMLNPFSAMDSVSTLTRKAAGYMMSEAVTKLMDSIPASVPRYICDEGALGKTWTLIPIDHSVIFKGAVKMKDVTLEYVEDIPVLSERYKKRVVGSLVGIKSDGMNRVDNMKAYGSEALDKAGTWVEGKWNSFKKLF